MAHPATTNDPAMMAPGVGVSVWRISGGTTIVGAGCCASVIRCGANTPTTAIRTSDTTRVLRKATPWI